VSFIHHDVTSCPFPTPAADLIFARFLVTHLDDPPTTVAEWSRQLTPSGRILLEEVENIRIEHPVFELYLRLVADSLERQGRSLYVGPRLDSGLGPALTVASSRVATLEVSDRDAARMFRLNLPTLRESGRVPEEYDVGALERLQADLDLLAFLQPSSSHITWELRQIVLHGENADRPTTVS